MTLRVVLAVNAVLLAGGVHLSQAETLREQSSQQTPIRGFSRLEVENSRGLIEVRTGADGTVKVTALKLVRGGSDDAMQDLARETQVETSIEGGRYAIKVRYPRRASVHLNFWDSMKTGVSLPRSEVRLSIEVPRGFPISLVTASGDVSTSGLSGPQRLKTASGDVSIESATGRLDAHTASGNVWASTLGGGKIQTVSGEVDVRQPRGSLRIETASGDVVVNDARDTLAIETVSGNVEVSEAPRGIDVRTASGDVQIGMAAGRVTIGTASGEVQVGLRSPLQRAEIETGSGDVEAGLVDLACALEMKTSSGSIDLDLPVSARTITRHLVTATVRNGTTPVSLRTVSGSISITGGR